MLYLLKLNRIEPWAAVKGTPIARNTWLGSSEPEVQAEPLLAQMPYLSSISRIASPSIYSKLILVVFGRRFSLSPFMLGGHQEKGRRAGTENVPGIVGLGKACELAAKNIEAENSKVKSLRDKLENTLLQKCPGSRLNGDKENRLDNTSNISFEYIEGEAILLMLDKFGICASSGSACTSGSLEPSHVLRAMGVPFTAAHGSVRFSLSRYNTEQEVDYTIEKLPEIVNRLRELSPFVT